MIAPAFPHRELYEAGGWNDGRLGQAYDLIAAVLTDRGERVFEHPLLEQIEGMDEALA
jgi:hypothetical protein